MREVLKIGMTDKNANCAPVVRSTSTPGYLELTSDQVSRLICQDSLEKHYEVEEQPFARGKYATVRRCRDRATGRQCAAKFLKKRRFSSDLRNEILHEVAVLEACKGSSRIVELHKVFESDNEMVLLLELACGGELQMLLDRDEVPSERQVVRLMKQILDGLVYLHSINVAHLDIKPQNLVLTGEFPDCDVKLCDFGISRYLSQGADVREILGTPDYVAPEVLNYEPISLATDMWSVGVLIYVLLTGCSPFGGDTKQETFCNITQCRLDFPDDLFEDISEEAKDLMVKLMVKAPSKRLTATECLQHPWFLNESTDLHKTALTTTINNSKATKPRTPVPSKKPIPATEECTAEEDAEDSPTFISTPKPTLTDKIVKDFNINLQTKCNIDSNPQDSTKIKGICPERRKSLMKNLGNLVERFSEETPVKSQTNPTNKVTLRQKDTKLAEPIKVAKVDSFRSMTRASGMQTMPVSGLLRYRVERSCNLISNSQQAMYHTGGHIERDPVFKFRRVYILDDTEDPSPPPSINGSLNSDTSSMSDSNSDTVSEMSIDSSSDRSSIISLDDSLDLAYSKLGHTRQYASCYNVWEAVRNSKVPRKGWPRECDGSFARALSRFSTQSEAAKEGAYHRQNKSLTVFNNNKTTMATTPSNGKKCVGLELMRERNGNLVVIREVKAINGSKYARCSEVKCESVQSRIRRLQVQNGIQNELAKDRFNIF